MPGYVMRPPVAPMKVEAPTTQVVALVMGSGGDPFRDFEQARALCEAAGRNVSIFAGNDMIEHFPHDIDHAVSLHPDKLTMWLPKRLANGFNAPPKVWAHRNYHSIVTHWTRDWQGSTGLFMAKIARECGHVHIILCGVPMDVEADHFVRQQPWHSAHGFRRGWNARVPELRSYVRSMGGWTQEQLGAPTLEWLKEDIVDQHRTQRSFVSYGGLKA